MSPFLGASNSQTSLFLATSNAKYFSQYSKTQLFGDFQALLCQDMFLAVFMRTCSEECYVPSNTFLRWFVVTFLQTLLNTKNTSLHLLWENFHTFRYLQPIRKWLKVIYISVILRTRPGICFGKTFIPFVSFGLFVGGLKSSTQGPFSQFTITNDRRQLISARKYY